MMIVEERMELLKEAKNEVATVSENSAKFELENLDIYNMKISQIDDQIRQIKMRWLVGPDTTVQMRDYHK